MGEQRSAPHSLLRSTHVVVKKQTYFGMEALTNTVLQSEGILFQLVTLVSLSRDRLAVPLVKT